jgi:hypothetical protein
MSATILNATSPTPLPIPTPRPNWSEQFLDSMRQIEDPPLDALMLEIYDKGGIPALDALKNYLYHWNLPPDDGVPQSIRDFMAQPVKYPSFIDFKKIALAEDLFIAYGPVSTVTLLLNAVPRFFTNAAGARSFYLAQIFSKESLRVRMREVPQFVINIAQRGGLSQTTKADGTVVKGPGIISAQKLRLAHARIRIILKAGKPPKGWNHAELGQPINQEDLAEALMHFSMSTVDGLELIGIYQTAEERAATLEAWRAVGFLLGEIDELQPTSVAEALWLRDTIMVRHMASTMEAKSLIGQMLAIMAEFLPWFYRNLPAALMRNQLGDKIADMVGVPDPKLLVAFFRVTRWLWRGDALFARLAEKISPYLVDWLINNPIGEGAAPVTAPPAVLEAWRAPKRVSAKLKKA